MASLSIHAWSSEIAEQLYTIEDTRKGAVLICDEPPLMRNGSTANSAARPYNAKNGCRRTTLIYTRHSTPKVHSRPLVNPPRTCARFTRHIRNTCTWRAIASLRPSKLTTVPQPPTEAINTQMSALSVEARKRAEKDSAKKAAKATAAATREAEKRETSKVIIKRVERQKRKYVTVVSGLEAHGHDLKKVAKDFGKKFACGSSVTKAAGGLGEEITVQGDLQADIEEYVLEVFTEIPEDNVECTEDKKKKAAGPV